MTDTESRPARLITKVMPSWVHPHTHTLTVTRLRPSTDEKVGQLTVTCTCAGQRNGFHAPSTLLPAVASYDLFDDYLAEVLATIRKFDERIHLDRSRRKRNRQSHHRDG